MRARCLRAQNTGAHDPQGSDAPGRAAPSFQQPLGKHAVDPNAAPPLPPHDAKQMRKAHCNDTIKAIYLCGDLLYRFLKTILFVHRRLSIHSSH